jgi:hypothetical protein
MYVIRLAPVARRIRSQTRLALKRKCENGLAKSPAMPAFRSFRYKDRTSSRERSWQALCARAWHSADPCEAPQFPLVPDRYDPNGQSRRNTQPSDVASDAQAAYAKAALATHVLVSGPATNARLANSQASRPRCARCPRPRSARRALGRSASHRTPGPWRRSSTECDHEQPRTAQGWAIFAPAIGYSNKGRQSALRARRTQPNEMRSCSRRTERPGRS